MGGYAYARPHRVPILKHSVPRRIKIEQVGTHSQATLVSFQGSSGRYDCASVIIRGLMIVNGIVQGTRTRRA